MSYNAMAHRNLLFHMCIHINMHTSCISIYIDARACMHGVCCVRARARVCVSLRMSVANIANITIVR